MPPLLVQIAALLRALPTPYLVMPPDLVIVDANEGYLATVGRDRDQFIGVGVFEAFPPTPDALDPRGVLRVQVPFERARETGRRRWPLSLRHVGRSGGSVRRAVGTGGTGHPGAEPLPF